MQVQWILIQFHADLSSFKERRFHLLPRSSRVLTSFFGWNLSSSSTAIRTVDTWETPHKRASYHRFSAAGRQWRAQVCSIAQVNERKSGAIWQTCRAWNSFLMFTPFTLELLQRRVAWRLTEARLRLALDHLQTISVMLKNMWTEGVFYQSKDLFI